MSQDPKSEEKLKLGFGPISAKNIQSG